MALPAASPRRLSQRSITDFHAGRSPFAAQARKAQAFYSTPTKLADAGSDAGATPRTVDGSLVLDGDDLVALPPDRDAAGAPRAAAGDGPPAKRLRTWPKSLPVSSPPELHQAAAPTLDVPRLGAPAASFRVTPVAEHLQDKENWQQKVRKAGAGVKGFVAPKPGSPSASAPPTAPAAPATVGVPLTKQQQNIVDFVLGKYGNIFFTGGAGTGKSETIKRILAKSDPDTTYVTALTGIAATPFPRAMTLHSFAGIGLGKDALPILIGMVRRSSKALHRWQTATLLIVDEVSMLSRQLFETLDEVGRAIRQKPGVPFGGLQLCFCGDFFQLPPVSKSNGPDGEFCFESPLWHTTMNVQVRLTQIFRQRDAAFIEALDEVRHGRLSPKTVDFFARLQRPLELKQGIEATRLFSVNKDVDSINNSKLKELPQPEHCYRCSDSHPRLSDQLSNMTLYPTELRLRVGAQVMMLKNDGDLVNGSRGVVEGFQHLSGRVLPVVRFVGGEKRLVQMDTTKKTVGQQDVSRTQLPLKLAWALTIHKAQGMSLDAVEVELSGVFADGQAYVALSRARTVEGLRVTGFNPQKTTCNRKVVQYTNGLRPA